MVVMVAVIAVALELILPPTPDSARWRLWLGRRWQAFRRRHRDSDLPDPFQALHLQTKLASLSDEITQLATDPEVTARVHKLEAARAAYDDLLDEACRLAGITVEADEPRTETTRWREEQELAAHGWSW
jgi:hypothetical protein